MLVINIYMYVWIVEYNHNIISASKINMWRKEIHRWLGGFEISFRLVRKYSLIRIAWFVFINKHEYIQNVYEINNIISSTMAINYPCIRFLSVMLSQIKSRTLEVLCFHNYTTPPPPLFMLFIRNAVEWKSQVDIHKVIVTEGYALLWYSRDKHMLHTNYTWFHSLWGVHDFTYVLIYIQCITKLN